MIFILHYILSSAGLSATTFLFSLFLRTYSDGSTGEIGTLLMLLPLASMLTRTTSCALADRHQAHKKYFLIFMGATLIGYGSFAIVPFTNLPQQQPRLAWYIFVVLSIIGYLSWSATWTLGDSLVVNYSIKHNTTFGAIRKWGTMSWGVFGLFVGQINDLPEYFPKYVPGFLVFSACYALDFVLVYFWNDDDFKMVEIKDPTVLDNTADLGSLKDFPIGLSKRVATVPSELCEVKSIKGLAELQNNDCIAANNSFESQLKTNLQIANISTNFNNKVAEHTKQQQQTNNKQTNSQGDLQMMLFKMIIRSKPGFFRYMIVLTALSLVFSMQTMFLFLHLEQVCNSKGYNFSSVSSWLYMPQAIIETLVFMFVGKVMKKVGHSVFLSIALFVLTFKSLFYAFILDQVSPYYALFAEGCHGLIYGICYSIITQIALEFASEASNIVPSLRKQGLIDSSVDQKVLELSLRSTFQGCFSAAFDGLGLALGSFAAGLYLEAHTFNELWIVCSIFSFLMIFVNHLCDFYYIFSACYGKFRNFQEQKQ